MSEAYWISGGTGLAEEWLSRKRIQPRWLDAVHLVDYRVPLPGFYTEVPHYCWNGQTGQDHALLHLLQRSLISGEQKLLLVQDSNAFALIAGPAAVGQYNLAPRARFTARWTNNGRGDLDTWLTTLLAAIDVDDLSTADIASLSLSGYSGTLPGIFTRMERQVSDQPVLERLRQLIEQIEQSRGRAGLLISQQPDGFSLATLLERI